MWRKDVNTRCLYTIYRGLSTQDHFGVSMISNAPLQLVSIPIGIHGPTRPDWAILLYLGQAFFVVAFIMFYRSFYLVSYF